jgi:DNA-binding transcriptional LysR family regulator
MPDINWNAVYGFWLVAEHGSFAAAARSLPRGSVQALQKRVRGLEKKHNLNLRLLRSRGAKGVELTEAGRRLYELLNPVFESFDALAGELRDEASGPLTVAMSTYASANYRAELLERFHGQYPAVTVKVLERPLVEVVALVEAGQADLGICSPPLGPSTLRISGRVPIRFEILAPLHYPTERSRISWKELVREPLVVPERGSVMRQAFEELLARLQLDSELRVACEVSTAEAAVEAVHAGYGLALTPVGPRLAQHLTGLRRLRPPAGLPRIDVAILRRRDRYMPCYMQALFEAAIQILQDGQPQFLATVQASAAAV